MKSFDICCKNIQEPHRVLLAHLKQLFFSKKSIESAKGQDKSYGKYKFPLQNFCWRKNDIRHKHKHHKSNRVEKINTFRNSKIKESHILLKKTFLLNFITLYSISENGY